MSQRMWRHSEHGHFIDSQTSNTHGCHEVVIFPVSEGRELWGVWDSEKDVWVSNIVFSSEQSALNWLDETCSQSAGFRTGRFYARSARVYIEPMEGEKK